jgi:DNA-binding transcriptional LysR family regulator
MDEIELRHLRYFVAVAEELHFGRAAEKLHMAQPPLSQQIKRLETLLGCELFIRTSRAVSLTAAGDALLERSGRLIARVKDDVEFVRRVGRGEKGKLRVGFVGSAMLTRLPETLHEYRRLFPDVELQLQEMYTASILDGLQQYSIDVGIVRDGDLTPNLESIPILEERLIAIVPRRHALAARFRIRVVQLTDEPFVFYPQSAGRTAWERTMQVCDAHGFRPTVVQEAPHWVTIVSLVGAGLGVSIAPECIAKITTGNVVSRPLTHRASSFLNLAYRPNETSPVVREFARLTQRVFASGRKGSSASN